MLRAVWPQWNNRLQMERQCRPQLVRKGCLYRHQLDTRRARMGNRILGDQSQAHLIGP